VIRLESAFFLAKPIQTDSNENFIPLAIASGRLFVLPTDGKETITVEPARPPPTALICPPCGIRFSSASTLEAHRTFYCAHRPRVDEDTTNDEDEDGKSGGKPESRKLHGCPHCSYRADKKVSLNRHMRMHAASPVPPTVPAAAVTTVATNPNSSASNPTAAGPQTTAPNGSLNEEAERYCRNCDIRFSSLKTYR